LLRGEQLDKTTRKIIKTVRLTNMLMQRDTHVYISIYGYKRNYIGYIK
jgi:hypothetical protein